MTYSHPRRSDCCLGVGVATVVVAATVVLTVVAAEEATSSVQETNGVTHGLGVAQHVEHASSLSGRATFGFGARVRADTDSIVLDVVINVDALGTDDLERETPDVLSGVDASDDIFQGSLLVAVPVVREALPVVRSGDHRSIRLVCEPGLDLTLENLEDIVQGTAVDVAVLQSPHGLTRERPRQAKGEEDGDLEVDTAVIDVQNTLDRELTELEPPDVAIRLGQRGVEGASDL